MSQILYRGKRKDNNEWIYGYVIQEPNGRTFIGTYLPGGMWDWVEVEAETVGRHVEFQDMNGVNVFTGDIVKWGHVPGYHENPVRIAEVKSNPDIQFDALIDGHRNVFHFGAFAYADVTDKALEIIGNRWDNPELMGKE